MRSVIARVVVNVALLVGLGVFVIPLWEDNHGLPDLPWSWRQSDLGYYVGQWILDAGFVVALMGAVWLGVRRGNRSRLWTSLMVVSVAALVGGVGGLLYGGHIIPS